MHGTHMFGLAPRWQKEPTAQPAAWLHALAIDVGASVGDGVGATVGTMVGSGDAVGDADGSDVGEDVGLIVGDSDGAAVVG